MPSFVPCLRLFIEPLAVVASDGLSSDVEIVDLPAMSLCFDYQGTSLRASDSRPQFFVAQGSSVAAVTRDHQGEAAAARILEGLGAVDLGCCPECQPDPSSEADYILAPEGGIHAWCSFTAALGELRTLGWRVEVADDYPYKVVEPEETQFYAEVAEDGKRPDWFGLELGIEVDGRRIDLLPSLLSWLDSVGQEETIDSLVRVAARFRAVTTSDGQHVLIPPDRLKMILQVLVELYQGTHSSSALQLQFPSARAASLAKLEGVFQGDDAALKWEGAAGLVAKGRTLLAGPAKEQRSRPPEGLTVTLRPYQERGLAWLEHLRVNEAGGVLADDMGLGKTLQTIAHLLAQKRAGRMEKPSLIIMPTSLVGNWRRELARFAPDIRVGVLHGPKRNAERAEAMQCDVVLTTYPILVRDLPQFETQSYYYIILDEAQAIKNRSSLAHHAVLALQGDHKLCLTGTPIENNLEELRSLFAFLMPGLLGAAEPFQAHFGRPIEQGGDATQLRALRDVVTPYLLRRMKEQVAPDLPPKTELARYVELRGEQRELYESIRLAAHADVRKAIKNKGLRASSLTILDALMKLRQVCCDPRLVSVDSAKAVQGSAKYQLLMELLESQVSEGRRVLVFSQFTTMLGLIAQGLDERGLRYVSLMGSTRDRQKPIDAFVRGDADIFLISLKAGGTGLNLTRADTVIHYDPWWNPAAQDQATDRAHRIGQTRPVFVYNLVAAGSVEERMLRLQERKRLLAESILGGNAGNAAGMSAADIDGLFAPLTA